MILTPQFCTLSMISLKSLIQTETTSGFKLRTCCNETVLTVAPLCQALTQIMSILKAQSVVNKETFLRVQKKMTECTKTNCCVYMKSMLISVCPLALSN